ncbi:geranylgeranyl reductase family protein [Ruegeria sp. HKCCSP346]|uniref:geranylgeranyl reductase family protein n=1 Tax=Ruegeria sp. HKCCSP346 TaxID=2794830 RepID=UPI001AE2FC07|nr:geranylgeranyl reductase family protein [Ruegeria sp. HKCCSP346]
MDGYGPLAEDLPLATPAEAAAETWDAIIVGAGPGGSAAAIELTRRGRKVILIDREDFPRDKSCGDGITRSGISQLKRLGILSALTDQQEVEGVRVHMRNRGHRDFRYEGEDDYGLVVPRLILDDCLLRQARAEGAAFLPKCRADDLVTDESGTVAGVTARMQDGTTVVLTGYMVIAADGAASRLAKAAGLRETPEQGYGTALRGYVDGCGDTPPLLEIMLPLTDVTDRYLLPSYGWAFPTGKGTANVGVGLFCRAFDTNVRTLFDQFLDALRKEYPEYSGIQLSGTTLGAPLRFDFAPERAAHSGLLLVGDAAGLISPFTGEGISFALESGVLAAQTTDRCLRTGAGPWVAADDYALLLGDRFAGYFTLGNRASRRYEFIWRVLDDTFESEKPVHNMLRRAVLVPEGTGGDVESAMLDDVSPLVRVPEMPLGDDLRDVGARLNHIVRTDWPFLTRMSFAGKRADMVAFRPSLLLLLTSYLGDVEAKRRRAAATALELAYLGFLAQSGIRGIEAAAATADATANWGDKLGILTGDYLLAKAHEVGARDCPDLVPSILSAMASACEGRVSELRTAWQPDMAVEKRIAQMRQCMAAFFRLPCELGAMLAEQNDLSGALRDYGENLGLAYLLTEDELALDRPPGSTPFASDLSSGLFSVPVLEAAQRQTGGAAVRAFLSHRDPARFLAELSPATRHIKRRKLPEEYRDQAIAALSPLPRGGVAKSLSALAGYAVSRQVPKRRVL